MAQIPARVNPGEQNSFDMFPLNEGLDFSSSKIMAPKGSLLDVSNREIVDRIGYKTIDGFEKYDGRIVAQTEFYYISADSYGGVLATDFTASDLLVVSDATSTVFGKVVATATIDSKPSIIYARLSEDDEPAVGENVRVYSEANDFLVSVAPTRYSARPGLTDASNFVDNYNTYNTTLRGTVGSLHDIPIGLHWYRDRLYSVVTDRYLYFNSGGPTEIQPNYFIKGATSGAIGRVLDVRLRTTGGGSWAGSDASGLLQYVLIGTTPFQVGENLDYDDNQAFSSPTTNVATTRAVSTGDPVPQFASLWESLDEQQAIDESSTVGWNRIDHGWEFSITDGFSGTGDLVKVSRGSTNNFAYETTSADNLTGGFAYNGMQIADIPFTPLADFPSTATTVENGDPGWKTNASTNFASNSALFTAVQSADSDYAYGNIMGFVRYFPSTGNYKLASTSRNIFGPANATSTFGNNLTITPSVGSPVSLPSDWYSSNARAPLVIQDLTAVANALPEGAVITGMEVVVSYTSRVYVFANFIGDRFGGSSPARISDYPQAIVDWLDDGFLGFGAGFVNVAGATSGTLQGSVRSAPIVIETNKANYTTQQITIPDTSPITYDSIRLKMQADKTGQTATIGGSADKFGLNLTRNSFLDSNFGFAIYADITADGTFSPGIFSMNSGGNLLPGGSAAAVGVSDSTASQYELLMFSTRLHVDRIKLKVYYTEPSARYYVGDGAGGVCSVDVTYTTTTSGSWTSSSAVADVQATNLTVVANNKRYIESGDKLFLTESDASGDTNSIANISSDAIYGGLPSFDRINDEASRYEFITANFFGREDWDGFYGVSGAGRAFSFATFDADGDSANEDYIVKITTNTNDTAGDKPRHIAFHHYSLALGFRSGIVRFSALGEPENFSGVDGAAEVGIGDRVTGLLPLQGATLGVFCENSIHAVAGTDVDNYQTQVLSPHNGAIEYTIVDMGIPVYCDSRGISTLEQSERYGNFLGQRLSQRITTWIVPRMLRNNAQFSGKGVVCAIPVRAKNQVRYFFKDGKCLVMTMNPDNSPVFTFSDYYIDQSSLTDTTKYLVPFAWSSQVDDKGLERNHFSHYSPLSSVSEGDGKYVYELDKGWSFSGKFIPAHYTINWYYRDPFSIATIRNIRIDGLTTGYSSCKVYTAKDYDSTFSTAGVDISLPRSPLSTYSEGMVPNTTMSHITERGRSISLKVSNEIPDGDTINDPIPADVHQVALVQFAPGGKEDS